MSGVLKVDEDVERLVDNNVPPTDASYHRNVPFVVDVADSTTEPAPQFEPFVPVGAAGTAFTIALTAVRLELVQNPLLNST
jgi:hypothetical protein